MAKKIKSVKVASVKKALRKAKTSVSKNVSRVHRAIVSRRTPRGFVAWLDSISPFSILVVGLCVVSVSIVSSFFIDLQQWYFPLPLSPYRISSLAFQYLLTGIFGFGALAIILLWNQNGRPRMFLMWLFILAGMLHTMWSMFFFGLHVMNVAFVIIVAQLVLLIAISLISWNRSRYAVLLLLPYLIWIGTVVIASAMAIFSF